MNNYDIIIIGAGAAGLMCAASASKRGRKVLLIDKAKKPGEKIRISGGGRCNFTNIHTEPQNFLSRNSHFCVSALQRFTAQDFLELLKKHKIAYHEKTLGQLFCDYSSQQIIDMLLTECKDGGVEIFLETEVKNIERIAENNIERANSEKVRETNVEINSENPPKTVETSSNNHSQQIYNPKNTQSKNFTHLTEKQNFQLQIKNSNIAEPLSQAVSCQSLVIATGGLSIPKMGATGFGYDVAQKFCIKIVEQYPALVPFTLDKTRLEAIKSLAGVAVDAIVSCKINSFFNSYKNPTANFSISHGEATKASLASNDAVNSSSAKASNKNSIISFREAILFTHRGLSGPAILQISSYWQEGREILINLAPQYDIYEIFLGEKKQKPKQEISTILSRYLPKSLANYIVQSHMQQGLIEEKPQWIADIPNQKLKEIANNINAWRLQPQGTEGYAKAEVTAGGVDTNEISSKTFECKSVPGLYFIGEVLDVTGHLGGFNFQWAWASGHAAGQFA